MNKASILERNEQIKKLYLAGFPYRQIAAQVGMSMSGVYRICQEDLDLPDKPRRSA